VKPRDRRADNARESERDDTGRDRAAMSKERVRGPVTVQVVRNGRVLKDIVRPLHVSGTETAVVYKGKLWRVEAGNRIVIDRDPLTDSSEIAGRRAETRGVPSTDGPGNDEAEQSSPRGTARAAVGAGPVLAVTSAEGIGNPSIHVSGVTYARERWDRRQLDVIEAPADARLLVDAGPGTGKTAVACRRVAWLIDKSDVSPSNVWLISFTRTAVREIRNRIGHYLQDPADLWSVRIATLDSQAWAIQSGFDAKASLTGSYEENIAHVRELILKHEGVFEYLASVEHLLIDEAQDIVGVRADLLLDLIQRLPPACGVTVFADEAQAIYGFATDGDTEDAGSTADAQRHLPARLRSGKVPEFRETSLSAIYRTNNERLRTLFTDVRRAVMATASNGENDRAERVTDMVRALADREPGVVSELSELSDEALSGTFVLFRRRIDALTAASFWGTAPHRIRMSGLPAVIEPWLAVIFWDWTARKIRKPEFERLWGERVEGSGVTRLKMLDAWDLLVKIAGESQTIVAMDVARLKLGRSAPPTDFVRPDFGLGGPVFGTIHGCKGREAQSVLLMLPASPREDGDRDEEARVVFVGATRARAELRVGKGFKFLASRRVGASGRAFALKTAKKKPHAQVEFGRQGDLTPEGVAGRSLYGSADQVIAAHNWLLAHLNIIVPAAAQADAAHGWRYRITPKNGPTVAYLPDSVNGDLFSIGGDVQAKLGWSKRLRPSYGPNHLKIFGACTLVLDPEKPDKDALYVPWSTSGFVLAPVVQGFDMIYFRTY
jgi:hypothetical protein